MKVLSLFDGISCGRIALERAGINVEKYYASEVFETAIKVSKENYPDIIQLGDISQLSVNNGQLELSEKNGQLEQAVKDGEFDLVMGGSPCQGFSIAGKRLNFDDPRSALFFEFIKILKELKPKYFLLENVKMRKDIQHKITKVLTEIYPDTQVYNFNSSLVSAQLRNRFYWTNIPGITPPEDKGLIVQNFLENGTSDRKKARAILESESRPLVTKEKMYRRYKQTGFTTIVFENGFEDKEHIRYFTQTELERLQTLPEGYTKSVNRNTAAGLIGNGWTVDMIAHIFKFI